MSPKQLTWVVRSVIPAVLWFAIQAAKRFAADEPWPAAGFMTMGALVVVGAALLRGPRKPGWKDLIWLCAFAAAIAGWLRGPSDAIRFTGFLGAIGIQIVVIVWMWRLKPPIETSPDERPVPSVTR